MGQDISGACGQLALKKGPSVGNGNGGAGGCGTGDIEDIGGVVRGAAGDDGVGLRRRGGSGGSGGAGAAGGRRSKAEVDVERPQWTWEDVALVFLLVVAFGSFAVMVASLGYHLWHMGEAGEEH